MRKSALSLFFLSVSYPFTFLTEAQTMTARVPMKEVLGREIVKVFINGNGPDDFVVDTRANVTLVKRQLLFKLNIPISETVKVITSLGESQYQRAQAHGSRQSGAMKDEMRLHRGT